MLWHLILMAPIIVWAFIVSASICPRGIQAMTLCTAHGCAPWYAAPVHWILGNNWNPQSTCLTGTSKDSQYKCEITSHLDSWVPNTSNPHYGKDHMRSFSRAGAVETKLILFVSERGSLYLQPEGMSSASLGRGSSQQSDKTSWTGMRKRLVISDRSLCCVGGVIQLLKTPQTTSSNHI